MTNAKWPWMGCKSFCITSACTVRLNCCAETTTASKAVPECEVGVVAAVPGPPAACALLCRLPL